MCLWFDRDGSIALGAWCDFVCLLHLITVPEEATDSVSAALREERGSDTPQRSIATQVDFLKQRQSQSQLK
jgi:hypothetical protein